MKHSEAVAAVETMAAAAGGFVTRVDDVAFLNVRAGSTESLGGMTISEPGRYAFVTATIAVPVK